MDGGGGTDLLDRSTDTSDDTLTLTSPAGVVTGSLTHASTDSTTHVENFMLGSGNDTFNDTTGACGAECNNVLWGNAGNDTFNNGTATNGNDTHHGGTGTDTENGSGRTTTFDIDMTGGADGDGADILIDDPTTGDQFENAVDGSGDDPEQGETGRYDSGPERFSGHGHIVYALAGRLLLNRCSNSARLLST